MPENKTRETSADVDAFLASVPHPGRRSDAERLVALFERVSGEAPKMWGPSIIGFGSYRYRYASGRTGESCRIGFSPRKAELVLYVGASRPDQAEHLARLGKHRTGKGCLYLKQLSEADEAVLEAIVASAYKATPEGEVTG